MKSSMLRAWLTGFLVLAAIFGVWQISLKLEIFSQSMATVLWLSPGIAAFATAYRAPSRKFLLGASMAIPAALLAVVVSLAYQRSSIAVDFSGLEGGLILFTLVFMGSVALASLGAFAAYVISRDAG